jgi:hypothetical protein
MLFIAMMMSVNGGGRFPARWESRSQKRSGKKESACSVRSRNSIRDAKYANDEWRDAVRSEVAGAEAGGVFRKWKYPRVAGWFGGEGAAFLASGDAAGVISVLFAVDPLEEDIEQEVTA